MDKQIESRILEILNADKTAEERKKELETIEIKGSCERKYYEEEEASAACYPFLKKRGIVEYYNCEDPSENRTYVGEWKCANY